MDQVRKAIMLPDDGPAGRGVRIALIDTGIDTSHPDLIDNIDHSHSISLLPTDKEIVDRHWHGTFVGGIILGSGALSDGKYRGMCPEAELVVIKVSNSGRGGEDTAIQAVAHALEADVDIINYSVGYSPRDEVGQPPWIWSKERSAIEVAFEEASSEGVLCVVAAGNDGPNGGSINRPGGLECVLTVGACSNDGVCKRSSRGPYNRDPQLARNDIRRLDLNDRGYEVTEKPDVVAPGKNIVAPLARNSMLDDDYAYVDPFRPELRYTRYHNCFTSFAAPVVTGLAAVILGEARSRQVELGPNPGETIKSLIRLSAAKLSNGLRHEMGKGIVNWPRLISCLSEFYGDETFRRTVLNGGPDLRLL